MKYIVYEEKPSYLFQPIDYKRYEIGSDEELKEFLYNNVSKIKKFEVFKNEAVVKIEVKLDIVDERSKA